MVRCLAEPLTLMAVCLALTSCSSLDGLSTGSKGGGADGGGGDATPSADGATHTVCPSGTADCSGTGVCDTNTNTETKNCGACAHLCGSINGAGRCQDGLCVFACDPGFAPCTGPSGDANGCATSLATDPKNCNGCAVTCPAGNHQDGTCKNGACGAPVCSPGYQDCNNNPTDGCEAQMNTPANCGSCGHVCGSANGAPGCPNGACVFTCNANYAHCGTNDATGCETNIGSDPNNCGSCGTVCTTGQCAFRQCG